MNLRRLSVLAVAFALLATACASSTGTADDTAADEVSPASEPSATVELNLLPTPAPVDYGDPPSIPTGDLDPEIVEALDIVFDEDLASRDFISEEFAALRLIAESEDPRLGWLLSDLLRISQGELREIVMGHASNLLGVDVDIFEAWRLTTDHLIAWDVPAPPDYLRYKRFVYLAIVPDWDPLFDLDATDVDWRYISWGGVGIDDQAFDMTDDLACRCIPAADNPEAVPAADTEWLQDDDVVFGVEVNGEARAYPRRIMEVREMVNDTLGGRDFGMPYCTLCGSAQVFFTDNVVGAEGDSFDRPVLRTSGLLSRSNKVMYDLNTKSVFDTFLGAAITGPLAEADVVLDQHTVVTTTWGQWRQAHPETTALVESLALGRDFDFRNGRDADGPIFPIGGVDPRLPVQADVVGVVSAAGDPVAFHVETALQVLADGGTVELAGVRLVSSGGGLSAIDAATEETISAHQAFWFAWSQFQPDTLLWPAE